MVGSEGVRSKARRYKRFVLHGPESRRLNETFVIQAQVRVEGIPDLLPAPPTHRPLGWGRGRSVKSSSAQLRLGGGVWTRKAYPSCWVRSSWGKRRSGWVAAWRQAVALGEL